jgi:hypothetical protein
MCLPVPGPRDGCAGKKQAFDFQVFTGDAMTEVELVNPHQNFSIQRRITSETSQKLFHLSLEEIAGQAHGHTVAAQK